MPCRAGKSTVRDVRRAARVVFISAPLRFRESSAVGSGGLVRRRNPRQGLLLLERLSSSGAEHISAVAIRRGPYWDLRRHPPQRRWTYASIGAPSPILQPSTRAQRFISRPVRSAMIVRRLGSKRTCSVSTDIVRREPSAMTATRSPGSLVSTPCRCVVRPWESTTRKIEQLGNWVGHVFHAHQRRDASRM